MQEKAEFCLACSQTLLFVLENTGGWRCLLVLPCRSTRGGREGGSGQPEMRAGLCGTHHVEGYD